MRNECMGFRFSSQGAAPGKGVLWDREGDPGVCRGEFIAFPKGSRDWRGWTRRGQRGSGSGSWERRAPIFLLLGLLGVFLVFLVEGRVRLEAVGFRQLLAQPFGLIDLRLVRRRSGVLLRGAGATVRDQAFDGYDHRHGLDLAGNAASGDLGPRVASSREAVQDLLAAQV